MAVPGPGGPNIANGADTLVVLVVEDEFLVRSSVAEYLHEQGCVVLEAESGDHAIAMCRSGVPVDVLFTDIHLNGSPSGWEVAEAFRATRADIPVVYASGNAREPARCVAGSVFFAKPYQPEDIFQACVQLSTA
jgi:CheY-like chemotaxis protein